MTAIIALAGNPNVGKSSIFNALTGAQQHVGNWPGKTVEKKEGALRIGADEFLVVDLPGTYSLTAYSAEEIIARDFIIHERPSAVITVVDAANLERNLYLVAQLLELEVPVVLALNMTDIARGRGMTIDIEELSAQLGGLPVVETVGNRRLGIEALKAALAAAAARPVAPLVRPTYGGALGEELAALENAIAAQDGPAAGFRPNWLAARLLEDDAAIVEFMSAAGRDDLIAAARRAQVRIEAATGEDAETLIADQRYRFIGAIIEAAVVQPTGKLTASDRIDNLVTHPTWGLPVFLLVMWLVFQFTAGVSAPYLDWIDGLINGVVAGRAAALMTAAGLGGWPAGLLTGGIIAGVGGVLVFIPVLLFLYIALGVLEDSGYMARAAFVMDRFMRRLGLQGKSFIPMIVGFGCTVPAVYATRTLDNEKDRKVTAFLATFMSCGARLPVYVLIGAAFFGARATSLVFTMYLLGIGVALAVAYGFKRVVYKGTPPAPFLMELPPYRAPHPRDVWRQAWTRTRDFLVNAGTIILGVSVVLWLLMAIPAGRDAGRFNDVAAEDSLFGAVSGALAPVFAPAGFGSWEATGSLVTGFLAKEVVVGTMNQIYTGAADAPAPAPDSTLLHDIAAAARGFAEATVLTVQEMLNIIPRTLNLLPGLSLAEFDWLGAGDAAEEDTTGLQSALVASFARSAGSPAAGTVAAVAFSVFVLLYVPCMAATAAMRHEFGGRWMAAQIGFTLALAWLMAVLVYQGGSLLLRLGVM